MSVFEQGTGKLETEELLLQRQLETENRLKDDEIRFLLEAMTVLEAENQRLREQGE